MDEVSILVVVDSGHQQRLFGFELNGCNSFNPCCRGFGSSTVTTSTRTARPIMFQSLLSWIRVLNSCTAKFCAAAVVNGFNPCCRGFGSSTVLHFIVRGIGDP